MLQTSSPICNHAKCESCIKEEGCFFCFVTNKCYHKDWTEKGHEISSFHKGCLSYLDQAWVHCFRTETVLLTAIGGVIGLIVAVALLAGLCISLMRIFRPRKVYAVRKRSDAGFLGMSKMQWPPRSGMQPVEQSGVLPKISQPLPPMGGGGYPLPKSPPSPTISTSTTATAKDFDTFSVFASPR